MKLVEETFIKYYKIEELLIVKNRHYSSVLRNYHIHFLTF